MYYHTYYLKHKADWAGIQMSDAYKINNPYYIAYEGRKKFFSKSMDVMNFVGQKLIGEEFELKSKPEIGFAFTSVPPALAALANLGLSIFLTAKRNNADNLNSRLEIFFKEMKQDEGKLRMCRVICKAIDIFLLYKQLSLYPEIKNLVEQYRIISASSIDLRKITNVEDLVQAAFFQGDLIPYESMNLQEVKENMFRDILSLKQEYVAQLNNDYYVTYDLACRWIMDIYKVVKSHYYNAKRIFVRQMNKDMFNGISGRIPGPVSQEKEKVTDDQGIRYVTYGEEQQDYSILGQTKSGAFEVAKRLFDEEKVKDLINTIKEASGNAKEDQVINIFDLRPAEPTPVQGEIITLSTKVSLKILGHDCTGHIQENLAELSPDFVRINELQKMSYPIEQELLKLTYPNVVKKPEHYLSTTG